MPAPASLPIARQRFAPCDPPEIPSNFLADDFDYARDRRALLTGLPARPGTRR